VNGFPLFGGQQLIKFGTVSQTGAVTSAASPTVGDLIVVNTSANPTSNRYDWHIVTTSGAVNAGNFRLDNSAAAPSYVASSVFLQFSQGNRFFAAIWNKSNSSLIIYPSLVIIAPILLTLYTILLYCTCRTWEFS